MGAVQVVALDVQSQSVINEPSLIILALSNYIWLDYNQINAATIDVLLTLISFEAWTTKLFLDYSEYPD